MRQSPGERFGRTESGPNFELNDPDELEASAEEGSLWAQLSALQFIWTTRLNTAVKQTNANGNIKLEGAHLISK